jgi:sulfoxide reductase heme-binding subunit YedZ
VGFLAFLILLPIALTSTRGWMKRLGQRWKRLHRWVYVAALLAVVHYVWLVKADIREPLLYGGIVVLLLLARLPAVRRRVSNVIPSLRRSPSERPSAPATAPQRGAPETTDAM